jgi:FtsP/CotA-like multicopper oxidase with cupredoxin domain
VSKGGCGIPFNLANIQDLLLLLGDKVADAKCQLRFEPEGVHERSLYGDINLVSGIPWPRMLLQPKWYRFKFLNAATSRPWLIKYKDDFGRDVGHEICVIYATDDGEQHVTHLVACELKHLYSAPSFQLQLDVPIPRALPF